jgi:hypothetical protein
LEAFEMELELVQKTAKQTHPVTLQQAAARSTAGGTMQTEDTAFARAPWLTPITYHAIDINEAPGRRRFDCRKVPVQLTVMGAGDAVLCATEGLTALNRVRVQRLVYEAVAQDGILGSEDIAFLLGISLQSVGDILAFYEGKDERLPCRG